MATKRKNLYRVEYSKVFDGIKKSKNGNTFAFCSYCSSDIDIGSTGAPAISRHCGSKLHNENLKSKTSTAEIGQFFLVKNTPASKKTSAAEAVLAYHTAVHSLSFRSNECTNKLLPTIFADSEIAKKYSSSYTKSQAIVCKVLAPKSVKELINELGDGYYSIATDASNHKEIKNFPIIIRYFSSNGLAVKLLDFANLPGETSDIIFRYLKSCLEKNNLDPAKLVAFSADNANVNFGGANQQGQNNVFAKLKTLNSKLIAVGCPAHICHNAAKKACDRLSLDVEMLLFKILSYFNGSTLRHEKFKEFCDFIEIEYATFPTHSRTRWLSMLPLIERILQLWAALKSLALSSADVPKVLENMFSNDSSEIYFLFLQSVLQLFQQTILTLEKKDLLLPEMIDVVSTFQQKMQKRLQQNFFGAITASKLLGLDDPDLANQLKKEFIDFYSTAIDYINKWFSIDNYPCSTGWLMLKTDIKYDEVQKSAEYLLPDIAMKDSLFDETNELNFLLGASSGEFNNLPIDKKWSTLFQSNKFVDLKILVSVIFSIPTSNSAVERVFSLCKKQWTDDRNRLDVETVKCLLQVKINNSLSCGEMYKKVLGDENLLNQISSNSKYM